MRAPFRLTPIHGHFRNVFSPMLASTPAIRDVAAYVAAALRSSVAADPKVLFLEAHQNVVTTITSDLALTTSICKEGVALAQRLCAPPAKITRLRLAGVGGMHSSHLRDMLSLYGEVKSIQMVTPLNRGPTPVYGTAAFASLVATCPIPPSVECESEGQTFTVTLSDSFASVARRSPGAVLKPPGEEELDEQQPQPASERHACRDWARGTCQRGPGCRFSHDPRARCVQPAAVPECAGQDAKGTATPTCRDWLRNKCTRTQCRFQHRGTSRQRGQQQSLQQRDLQPERDQQLGGQCEQQQSLQQREQQPEFDQQLGGQREQPFLLQRDKKQSEPDQKQSEQRDQQQLEQQRDHQKSEDRNSSASNRSADTSPGADLERDLCMQLTSGSPPRQAEGDDGWRSARRGKGKDKRHKVNSPTTQVTVVVRPRGSPDSPSLSRSPSSSPSSSRNTLCPPTPNGASSRQ